MKKIANFISKFLIRIKKSLFIFYALFLSKSPKNEPNKQNEKPLEDSPIVKKQVGKMPYILTVENNSNFENTVTLFGSYSRKNVNHEDVKITYDFTGWFGGGETGYLAFLALSEKKDININTIRIELFGKDENNIVVPCQEDDSLFRMKLIVHSPNGVSYKQPFWLNRPQEKAIEQYKEVTNEECLAVNYIYEGDIVDCSGGDCFEAEKFAIPNLSHFEINGYTSLEFKIAPKGYYKIFLWEK